MPLDRKVAPSAVPLGLADSNSKRSLTKESVSIEDGEPSKRVWPQDLPSVSYTKDDKVNLIDDDLTLHCRWQASK